MNKLKSSQGFTLIELIVVIIIITIITSIAILQISSYRRGTTVESVAEEIALNIRRAQTMALAVRSTGGFLPAYQNGYGIHFELAGQGGTQGSDPKSYILFTDYEANPGPGGWDRAYLKNFNQGAACGNPSQTIDECVEKINIDSGDSITDIEVCSLSGSSYSCSPLIAGQRLDITFLRPNLDAFICTNDPLNGGCRGLMPTIGYAKITVTSPMNTKKTVTIWSTGHISIE